MINIIKFFIIQTIYVSLNTVCAIGKIKFKPWVTAVLSAITYGLYAYVTIMVVMEDIPIWLKVILTAIVNFIAVFFSMNFVEKVRKQKRWDITVKAPSYDKETDELLVELFESGASFHYEDISKPTMIYDGQVEFRDYIDIHISTFSKQESSKVVDIISKYKGFDVVTYEEAR